MDKFSSVGLGTHVIEQVSIGQHSVIGAGSLVLKDVDSFEVAYGNPSRIIRKRRIGDPYLTAKKFAASTTIKSIASNF